MALVSAAVNKRSESRSPSFAAAIIRPAMASRTTLGRPVDLKRFEGSFESFAHSRNCFGSMTGYGAADVPARHANVSRVEKPVTPGIVCRALEAAIAAHSKD
jgi:hypothetical protein